MSHPIDPDVGGATAPTGDSPPLVVKPDDGNEPRVRFPLSYKLWLFAGVLLLSHLAAVGWAAVSLTRQTVVAAELDKQHAVIETTVMAIEAGLSEAEDGLSAIAGVLVDETIDPDARVSLVAIVVASNGEIDNAVIYDEAGRVVDVTLGRLTAQQLSAKLVEMFGVTP